jgi:hypothetical protein
MLAPSVNIFLLGGLLLASFVLGLILRGFPTRSLRHKIAELEAEVRSNHADILEMQKERVLLEQKFIDTLSEIPVIPMKGVKEKDDKNSDAVADITLRKKLLTKQSADK